MLRILHLRALYWSSRLYSNLTFRFNFKIQNWYPINDIKNARILLRPYNMVHFIWIISYGKYNFTVILRGHDRPFEGQLRYIGSKIAINNQALTHFFLNKVFLFKSRSNPISKRYTVSTAMRYGKWQFPFCLTWSWT